MARVVGVRFKKAGKIYYFDPGDLNVASGQNVIVETSRGVEFGEVVVGPKMVEEKDVVQPLKQVQRLAGPGDEETLEKNRELAKEAFRIGIEKVEEHKLPMKLVDVEYTFDHGKLIFYFTADGRIDFRELVKDLASVFKTRIELRQIGVRDEAKMLGGIGPCGRPLCCATFLGEFDPVSIRMAKEQNLSLNPSKISGICGRLMCCLKYESELYREQRAELPEKGTRVFVPDYGEAEVKEVEPLKKKLTVKPIDGLGVFAVEADEVEVLKPGQKGTSKEKKSSKRESGPQTSRRTAQGEAKKQSKGGRATADQQKTSEKAGKATSESDQHRSATDQRQTLSPQASSEEKKTNKRRRSKRRRRPKKQTNENDHTPEQSGKPSKDSDSRA